MASATDPGVRPTRTEDTLAVFTVSAPTEDWDIPVLAVADGGNGRARGGLATSLAADALTDALSGRMLALDLTTRGWQTSVAEAVDAAYLQASRRVAGLAQDGGGPALAMLTTALIVGDWLAVAHVGTARAYLLSRGELEQLTLDGARGALGEPGSEAPSMRFARIRPGDVVLVCSDGLHRYVDGEELAGHLAERRSLGDIAATLIALARARGGEDNIVACLARIGRAPARGLPEPEPLTLRLSDQVGTALLPRYTLRRTRRWRGPVLKTLAGVAVAGALAALAVRGWQYAASRVEPDAFAAESVARETLATRQRDVAQAPVPETVPPRDVVVATPPAPDTVAAEPPAAAPAPTPAPAAEATTKRSIADSIAEARREKERMAPILEKARRDSVAKARAAEDQRLSDSLAAVQLAALHAEQEKRARDSAAVVEQRRRDAESARERELADQRSREETARTEEARRVQEREDRQRAGRIALEGWFSSLTGAIGSGNASAPVLRAGPPRFAEFVGKNKPEVSGERITQMSVTEQTGTANAEFTLRWKSEFGTSTSRRVRATASVVPQGDGWQLRGWQILDGAP